MFYHVNDAILLISVRNITLIKLFQTPQPIVQRAKRSTILQISVCIALFPTVKDVITLIYMLLANRPLLHQITLASAPQAKPSAKQRLNA